MTHFSTIGLIGHLNSERAIYSLKRLIRFLQQRNKHFILEAETAALITDTSLTQAAQQILQVDELGKCCDLVIVVGGDGSLLRGARALAKYQVPLLGINRGRLGFLTDITPEDIEQKLEAVLRGEFNAERRFLLDMAILRQGQLLETGEAFNDVVLHPGQFIHMLEFEIYVDGSFVTSQRSDGVIVATPTGSTAYSLSGGGPILHPTLDAIVIVPMNPHTLSSRPIVVPGNSQIKIIIGQQNRAQPIVSCDGSQNSLVEIGDEILIRKKPELVELLHPLDYNFYERCRSKLGWGGHLLNQ